MTTTSICHNCTHAITRCYPYHHHHHHHHYYYYYYYYYYYSLLGLKVNSRSNSSIDLFKFCLTNLTSISGSRKASIVEASAGTSFCTKEDLPAPAKPWR